jgi:hypothetical protein
VTLLQSSDFEAGYRIIPEAVERTLAKRRLHRAAGD